MDREKEKGKKNEIKAKEKLTLKLEAFIKDNIDAAPQGSQQWLNERTYIIGGSEMSTIEGCNPYSKLVDLVAQKTGLTSFNGNAATRWGNLFENVSELLFKTMFNTEIYNTGGIQHKTIKNHKYSPDGLCVMQFNTGSKNESKIQYKTALLEFKSPFGTVPSAKVPKHYLSQVKAGLCSIDIADKVVFVNNMFRRCSIQQLDFTTNYNNRYHKDTEKKLKDIDTSIANGMILFYISKENLPKFHAKYVEMVNMRIFGTKDGVIPDSENDSDSDLDQETPSIELVEFEPSDDSSDSDYDIESEFDINNVCDDGTNILYKINDIIKYNTKLIDFGDENAEMFEQFLELYKSEDGSEFIDIKCIKPQINKEFMKNTNETLYKNLILPNELNYIKKPEYLQEICKKYDFDQIIEKFKKNKKKHGDVAIGYLPWKLVRSSHIIVERDPDYLDSMKDKINTAIDIVVDIVSTCSTLDEKANKLEEYFENNKVTKNYFENKTRFDLFF